MKHATLTALVLLYIVTIGQNWGHYAGALMLAVIWRDYKSRPRMDHRSPSGG
jgi:hypothetical protein